jgi:hypothetical protein
MSLLFDTARALLAAEVPASFLDRLYAPVADLLDLDVYVHHGLSPEGAPYLAAYHVCAAFMANSIEPTKGPRMRPMLRHRPHPFGLIT